MMSRKNKEVHTLIQKEDHDYLNWNGGSGHGGREFKRVKKGTGISNEGYS